jgi:hypothetical protein
MMGDKPQIIRTLNFVGQRDNQTTFFTAWRLQTDRVAPIVHWVGQHNPQIRKPCPDIDSNLDRNPIRLKWIPKDCSKILLDLAMNQFSDQNSQTPPNQKPKTPLVVFPPTDTNYESMECSADQLESRINRLVEEDSNWSVANQVESRNFDVLDYARLSSIPPTNLGETTPEQSDTQIEQQYGERDPFVDPAELIMNP